MRLRVPVTVAPGTDVRLVQRLLVEAAKSNERVAQQPEPAAALTTLGGTSIGFELLVWYDGQQCSKQEMLSSLYFAISDALKAHEVKTA